MTNYFLMSLAVTDLMVALLVMPIATVILMEGYFPLPPVYCLAWVSLDVLCCTCSIMHLCTISVDRYLCLRYPMTFGRNKTKRRVVLKLCIVWALSVAMSLPLSILYEKDSQSVIQNGVCNTLDPVFAVVGSVISFFIPLLIMVTTYLLTVRLLRKKQNNIPFKSNRTISDSTTKTKTNTGCRMGLENVCQSSVRSSCFSATNPHGSLFSLNKTSCKMNTLSNNFLKESGRTRDDGDSNRFEFQLISRGKSDVNAKSKSINGLFTGMIGNRRIPLKPLTDNLRNFWRNRNSFSTQYKTSSDVKMESDMWKTKLSTTKSQRNHSCPALFSNFQYDDLINKALFLPSKHSLRPLNHSSLSSSSLFLGKDFDNINQTRVSSIDTRHFTEKQIISCFEIIPDCLLLSHSSRKSENQTFQHRFETNTELFSSSHDKETLKDFKNAITIQSTITEHASSSSKVLFLGCSKSFYLPSQSTSHQETCSEKDHIQKKIQVTLTEKEQTMTRRNLLRNSRIIKLEQKATKVLGVVFFAFVFLWSPFFVTNLIWGLYPNRQDLISPTFMYIFGWMGYSSSMVNPICYTIFNRTFRQTFLKILTGKWDQVGQ
ncbi:D(2) dopamine receptor-like [Limulus polyphemus]|uniref:D(2) dopamine receptor-like n=1 Tax=Limulus polyphemus TaxID=6850 RepID=A0ABM1SJF8_LIMPO|nr:D(2) dopamine receptor-like [Limulus polyphemus]